MHTRKMMVKRIQLNHLFIHFLKTCFIFSKMYGKASAYPGNQWVQGIKILLHRVWICCRMHTTQSITRYTHPYRQSGECLFTY